ncbi:hypothetical protein TCAL_14889 [Tigriopus californicus]|uniref:SRP9 domain-containing protein n=1 Tax=Tigriopus californicus TaxID=6832 RepID=A0A553P3W0_TIGCA|nr:hypothetical protein TCAL_14889 [Tigriopus californicus]
MEGKFNLPSKSTFKPRILSGVAQFVVKPEQARYTLKYDHVRGSLEMKMTDDIVCLLYKSDAAQDVKKMEKFITNLMRHMASSEEH